MYSVLSSGPPGSRPKLNGLTAGIAPAEPLAPWIWTGSFPSPSSKKSLNFGTPSGASATLPVASAVVVAVEVAAVASVVG